jgi:serine/threonine protein kinase
MKTHKVASTNPFKSDLFSFGLVMLYMLTLKKFKSHERLDIDDQTYREVIQEWVKEARELTDGDPAVSEVLRHSLEFDEFRRPSFKSLKFAVFN